MKDVFWIVLLPLSWLWGWVALFLGHLRARRSVSLGVRTISVGNIHSGGSGKTPLTLEILKHTEAHHPVLVTRGYRSQKEKAGAELDREVEDGPALYGDEPWMIAQEVPVPILVGRQRRRWAPWFQENSGGLAVLDDGFQHRQVRRDLDLVLISTRHRLEENFCIPLGQLREPIGALGRAGAVLILEEEGGDSRWHSLLEELVPHIPRFKVRRANAGFSVDGHNLISPPQTVVAFAGIAWPEGFFGSLRDQSNVLETHVFPDHHRYKPSELRSLLRRCRARGASLVTTDKDWYKVRPWFKKEGVAVYSLKSKLEVDPAFWPFLDRSVGVG